MIQYDLLTEALISITPSGGGPPRSVSLPELYAALVRDMVEDFPALRPHQRHVWHAFLVQVGALAMQAQGLVDPPDDQSHWRVLLSELSRGSHNAAAWCLVGSESTPRLLQPPSRLDETERANVRITPDSLDVLVPARNHDLKRQVMMRSRPEHWLYALVSLQTQAGSLGAFYKRVTRMNGSYGNRSGFGVSPAGGAGRRILRDLRRLLSLREWLLSRYPYRSRGGHTLLWLLPWDGKESLAPTELDPFYVEICRRVALTSLKGGLLRASLGKSAVTRVATSDLCGNVGDPWGVLVVDKNGKRVAATMQTDSLTYRRLVPVLFPTDAANSPMRAPMQVVQESDDSEGLRIIARVLVMGDGRTEGFHERTIAVSRMRRAFMADVPTDPMADLAHERVRVAGEFVDKAFKPAALLVFTTTPGKSEREKSRGRDDKVAKERAESWCKRLNYAIDVDFFERLDDEAGASTPDEALTIRRSWLEDLGARGRVLLAALLDTAPDAAMRHYRVRVRATDRYAAAFARFLRDSGFEPSSTATATDEDDEATFTGGDDS